MSEHVVPNYLRHAVTPEVKAVNKAAREIAHLISTPSVDRAGDVVEPGGAQLDNFLKNPIVLRDHMYTTENVIGRATSMEITNEGIWARTQFRDTPAARDAFNLASEGLGGWSIGFRPVTYEAMKDEKGVTRGFRFKSWELLEYSIVAIPMNQDAVQSAVKRGLVAPENVSLFFKVEQAREATPAAEKAPAAPERNAEPEPQAVHPALADVMGGFDLFVRDSRRLDALRRAMRRLKSVS